MALTGPRVLVTDGVGGQSRSTLAAVRALVAAGYVPTVTTSVEPSLAAASRHCDRRVLVPTAGDAGYAPAVARELARDDYLTVLPTSDAALVSLQTPGVSLVDKSEVSARAARAGLPTLPERHLLTDRDLTDAASSLPFPAVVKPMVRNGGSAVVQRVGSASQLWASSLVPPLVVQPWVDEPMTAISGVVWQGALRAVVHQRAERLWPPLVGTSCWAITTLGDRELEDRLLDVLDSYEGVFQAQFLGPYLIDVNPRVYGSLPLAVAAGANLPAIYCDLLRGEHPSPVRGRAGVGYRWLEGDLRHAWWSWRRGRTSPVRALSQLRPRRRTAHSTESLTDPGPSMVRLSHALRSITLPRPAERVRS